MIIVKVVIYGQSVGRVSVARLLGSVCVHKLNLQTLVCPIDVHLAIGAVKTKATSGLVQTLDDLCGHWATADQNTTSTCPLATQSKSYQTFSSKVEHN